MTNVRINPQEVVELTQLLHAFIGHLDERRYGSLVDMFVADGRWLRQGRWLEGRDAILQALQARPSTMRVRHVISNVHVASQGSGVMQVDAYMTAYRQLENQPASLFSINLVKNVFRHEGGQWMLAEQQLVREFEFEAA